MKKVIVRSNREYDYFGNVIEYENDYLAFWTNVLEYEYDYYEYKYRVRLLHLYLLDLC